MNQSNNNNYIPDKILLNIGFWSGLLAFFAVTAFGVIQISQVLGFLDFPMDEILIYGASLCITIPFMLEMLVLHHITKPGKQFWTHTAIIFTIMYVVFVVMNYVVQLATVIPMTLKGHSADVALLRQTPHSLFWDLDAIGYIAMGFATLFTVPAFKSTGFQKWVRLTFLGHSLTTPLIAFVYFSPIYSNQILLIASPWIITAPMSMLLLALLFRNIAKAI